MRRRQLASSSSSYNSDESHSETCFDTVDQVGGFDSDTNPTDVDTNTEGRDEADKSRVTKEDEDYPPDYYLNLEEDPESDDENEDYKDSSRNLIDGMEERFRRSVPTSFLPALLCHVHC